VTAVPSPGSPLGRAELGLLLRVAHRRASRAADEALRPLGIEGRHLGVLLTLSRRGVLSQTQLVDALGADKSAMVRTIDDLERLGAATRRPDPADRRARLVELTESGRELLAEAQQAARQVADDLFGSFSESEYQLLKNLLTRVTQS
jgi:DNA-binding MarR family transcriptional regulator